MWPSDFSLIGKKWWNADWCLRCCDPLAAQEDVGIRVTRNLPAAGRHMGGHLQSVSGDTQHTAMLPALQLVHFVAIVTWTSNRGYRNKDCNQGYLAMLEMLPLFQSSFSIRANRLETPLWGFFFFIAVVVVLDVSMKEFLWQLFSSLSDSFNRCYVSFSIECVSNAFCLWSSLQALIDKRLVYIKHTCIALA